MLSARDAFKAGFLERCAANGLTADQIQSAAKTAEDKLAGLVDSALKGAGKAVGGLASGAVGYGVPLALAAPPVLGGVAGYALAKATDIDDTDIDAIKADEVIAEYRRQAERMNRQRIVRNYQQLRRKTGRIFS